MTHKTPSRELLYTLRTRERDALLKRGWTALSRHMLEGYAFFAYITDIPSGWDDDGNVTDVIVKFEGKKS